MPHNPYEHRQREVVYIMDTPPPRTNGLGVTGFVFSILGLVTCGLLSPLGLLFSFFGLFKAPRGMAVAGTMLSLLGTGMIGSMVYLSMMSSHQRHQDFVNARLAAQTRESAAEAKGTLEAYREDHQGEKPTGIEGNKLIFEYQDAWKQQLQYEAEVDRYRIRSAGPDGSYNTHDDVVLEVLTPDDQRAVSELMSPDQPFADSSSVGKNRSTTE